MQTFTLEPRHWFILRAFGRNPLLRRADRIEALVIMFAILVSLVAAPAAGAVGTAVYDVRHHRYAAEAQSRHPVKTGDRIGYWVDDAGNLVNAPASTSRAGVEAFEVGYGMWFSVTLATAYLAAAVRRRLDRARDAQWEGEFECLADGGGGRSDRQS